MEKNDIKNQLIAQKIEEKHKKKVELLEREVLQFSGLKIDEELKIYDVPINLGKNNYIHTTKCGLKNTKPLVLLHGYGGSNVTFYKLIKELSENFIVYSIDILGMGISSRPKFNLKSIEETIEFFVESLELWRIEEGLEKFYLSGHSFGGFIAGNYALKYEKNLIKLILISPFGITEYSEEEMKNNREKRLKKFTWKTNFLKKIVMLFVLPNDTPSGFYKRHSIIGGFGIGKYISKRWGIKDKEGEKLIQYFKEMFNYPNSSEMAFHNVMEIDFKQLIFNLKFPLENRLRKLNISTIFYFGEFDWMDITGAKNLHYSTIDKFAIKIIPKSGHHINIDNPKFLADEIIKNI